MALYTLTHSHSHQSYTTSHHHHRRPFPYPSVSFISFSSVRALLGSRLPSAICSQPHDKT